ncbi:MAG: Gmad2 immunoglobulin-like domain-containing protein [Desulfovermiculus sp.]
MFTKTLLSIGIILVLGILVLVIYGVDQEREPPAVDDDRIQTRPRAESADQVYSGYVYWDQRHEELKYQPCGDKVRVYTLQAADIKNDTWSELVHNLKQRPHVPRFVVLAGAKKESMQDKDERVLQAFEVIRIDAQGNCKEDKIMLTSPLPGEKIDSPLLVQGRARGNWFFEGDFPVLLTNWDGLIIAQGVASAQGEWMTRGFVSFTCRLTFESPAYDQQGTLILRKDNPSDNPALDEALEIPVRFQEVDKDP